MNKYIALRLRKLPILHWFMQKDTEFEVSQKVILKTKHGTEVGKIIKIDETRPKDYSDSNQFIFEIIRQLSNDDKSKLSEIAEKEKDAFVKTRSEIKKHKLNMKLLKAEYLFDYSRIIFYFKSENKVDFRELLKSLASIFRTRIELRQIGVRDEAKLLGGIGCCGKEVCCAQFMTSFIPVSTKMAKDQNLSLNPSKLSGICGRLLCCLSHEHKYYSSFKGKYPKIGSEIVVGEETARVMDINYITLKMSLGFRDRRKVSYPLDVVKGKRDKPTGRNLWWIQGKDEPEPDLSVLLENLNPPGTGKKKKRSNKVNKESNSNSEDSVLKHDSEDNKKKMDKKISDSPQSKDES